MYAVTRAGEAWLVEETDERKPPRLFGPFKSERKAIEYAIRLNTLTDEE